jgi:hypothetical protein
MAENQCMKYLYIIKIVCNFASLFSLKSAYGSLIYYGSAAWVCGLIGAKKE